MTASPAALGSSGRAWWRDAVVYQVYVKSFADSNGDGIGDLDGVVAKLPYLADLGVDGIWLNPCYPTPDRDGGYDVSDYFDIAEVYGGLPALERLVAGAHERGLRVLLDIVPNHCSSEHAWFQAALAEPPGGDFRSRFFFRDGRGHGGDEPPNNWQSVFGGPAWTRVREPGGRSGQWYLHPFDAGQPDFDWRNPEVPCYFEEVLGYWFDRGIDGFRIDVAHGLLKEADLRDVKPEDNEGSPMTNHADVHDVYRSWRSLTDAYAQRQVAFVGEIWAPDVLAMTAYVRPDELHLSFNFDLLMQPWSAPDFRASIELSLAAMNELGSAAGALAWTLNNHDVHRSVSRYGLTALDMPDATDPRTVAVRPRGDVDVALGLARARAAALFLLCLPGSAYIYQGEELGLPEVMDLPDEVRQDPIWFRSGGREVGRDGCRVPLPWTDQEPTFGFELGSGGAAPWLPQPAYFGEYAASNQVSDPHSTLSLYRSALSLRRKVLAGAADTLDWLELPGRDDVLAYSRGRVTVVCVFGQAAYPVPESWGKLVLASATVDGQVLPGPSTGWFVR